MKKSNKILLVLAGIFLVAYLSNMVFHIVNLKKAEKELFGKSLSNEELKFVYKKADDRLNAWTDKVNVICLNSNSKGILSKFRVEGNINYINIVNKQQKADFYRNIQFHGDTLFVSEKAAYVINPYKEGQEYYIGLPYVKQLYWNGKLVKSF